MRHALADFFARSFAGMTNGSTCARMIRAPQEPGTVPAGSFATWAAISPGWVSQTSSR